MAQRNSATTHTLDETPPPPPAWLVAELTRRHGVDLLIGVSPASPTATGSTETLPVDVALGPSPWLGKAVLVNPPHRRGAAGRLLDRALHEVRRPDSGVTLVALIMPADGGSLYFHRALQAAVEGTCELLFVRGRLTFGGRERASTTGTVIALLRRNPAPGSSRRRRRCNLAAVSTITTPMARRTQTAA